MQGIVGFELAPVFEDLAATAGALLDDAVKRASSTGREAASEQRATGLRDGARRGSRGANASIRCSERCSASALVSLYEAGSRPIACGLRNRRSQVRILSGALSHLSPPRRNPLPSASALDCQDQAPCRPGPIPRASPKREGEGARSRGGGLRSLPSRAFFGLARGRFPGRQEAAPPGLSTLSPPRTMRFQFQEPDLSVDCRGCARPLLAA